MMSLERFRFAAAGGARGRTHVPSSPAAGGVKRKRSRPGARVGDSEEPSFIVPAPPRTTIGATSRRVDSGGDDGGDDSGSGGIGGGGVSGGVDTGSDDLGNLAQEAGVYRQPFIAPPPARWRERYAPVCASCEAARLPCRHHPEVPLKLLVIGMGVRVQGSGFWVLSLGFGA
jgi:hypothetical protein